MTAINKDEQKKLDEQKAKDEQKRKDEEKASQNAEAKKEVKPVDFVRRDLRPGVYSTSALGSRIQIRDRNHYIAKTKAEIEFLRQDPEIIVFKMGKKK